jgi:hypothetical protein
MNSIQIQAFINGIKNKKNEAFKKRRELVVKTNNSCDITNSIINASLFQQTNNPTDERKIAIR